METTVYVILCVITLLPALYALWYFVTWLLGWRGEYALDGTRIHR